MSRLEPVSASAAVGSIVVERVLDAVAVFGLAAVAVLHPSFPLDEVRGLGALLPTASAVMALGLAALILLLVFPGAIVGYARRLVPALPGRSGHLLVEVLEAFLTGFRSLRSPRLLAAGILWSFAFWGWNAVSFLLAFRAFGIQEGYGAALFVQAVIALGVAIPAAPGYFGTFHAAAVVALHEVYGVAEGATLAFAFGYHLGGFVPVTLLGLWYAWRLGLTLVELRRAEEVVEAELEGSPGSATATGARTARDDAPSRPSRPDRP
jgi:hypothetical protein